MAPERLASRICDSIERPRGGVVRRRGHAGRRCRRSARTIRRRCAWRRPRSRRRSGCACPSMRSRLVASRSRALLGPPFGSAVSWWTTCVGCAATTRAAQRVGIERVDDHRRRAEALQHRGVRRRARRRRHLMTGGDERANQRNADRSGSSRNEDVHDVLSCRDRDPSHPPIAGAQPPRRRRAAPARRRRTSDRHSAATWAT